MTPEVHGHRAAARAAGATMLAPHRTMADVPPDGLPVIVWTVNDLDEMAALIDRGVSAIVTDYPDRLRRVMGDLGLPLPPSMRRSRPEAR
jgi:glycerophosphoryl diester phosphodiesterase